MILNYLVRETLVSWVYTVQYDAYNSCLSAAGLGGYLWSPSQLGVSPVGHPTHFPSGNLPNPKVASHENESAALGVKKRYGLIILFGYLFPYLFSYIYRISFARQRGN